MVLITSEKDIVDVIRKDEWMMEVLGTLKTLNLPDWWICAGFVRSKIWDVIHKFSTRTTLPDVDVIYFDSANIDEREEKKIERKLKSLNPNIPWSVKNQARMHVLNNMAPYVSSVDGISKFPETVTALGVKLDEDDNVILTAPWGIEDVVNLKVKPTPYYLETDERINIYVNRVTKKNWTSMWGKVEVYKVGNSSSECLIKNKFRNRN